MILLKRRKIKFSDKYTKGDRPFYLIKDNESSKMRISKITNFNSVEENVHDKKITKALIIDNYFDTDYVRKIKKEAIKYPISKELE